MKILVVDDQPNLARVTAVALRMLGCETRTAGTSAEATQIITGEKIDAVFLDVNLAGESGFEFLSQLVAQSNLPVVMFTAQSRDEVVDEALRRGALDCLMKPYTLDDLRLQLARIEARLGQSGSSLGRNPTNL